MDSHARRGSCVTRVTVAPPTYSLEMRKFLFLFLLAAPAATGSWLSDSYTNAAGTRGFQLYVPAGYTKGEKRPLLVHIHGCTETPGEFAGLTRIAQLAEKERLLVLLPGQSAAANPSLCWNWFLPQNQKRGEGE